MSPGTNPGLTVVRPDTRSEEARLHLLLMDLFLVNLLHVDLLLAYPSGRGLRGSRRGLLRSPGEIFFSGICFSSFNVIGALGASASTRESSRSFGRPGVGRHPPRVSFVIGGGCRSSRRWCDRASRLDVTLVTVESGSGIGSIRSVHPPQRKASSTTSAWVDPVPRKSSRMKGSVFAWSSQTPRPQNRHTPTAVRRQCQQSMDPLYHALNAAMSFGGSFNTRVERVPNHTIEPLSGKSERTHGSAGDDGGGAWDVAEERDLQMAPGLECAQSFPSRITSARPDLRA